MSISVDAMIQRVEEFAVQMSSKLTFIERREMSLNTKPFESVRVVSDCILSFNPQSDATWPLRQMRDHLLDLRCRLRLRTASLA